MIQHASSNWFGTFILVALVAFAIMMIRKRSGFVNPMHDMLDNNSYSGSKDLNNKLIDYYHQVLTKYIDYYRKLDKPDRRKFINRLHEFIETMEFRGEEGQEINLKVCVLCAAPAIQISMGLDTYIFNSYHTIIVYPRQFYSERHGAYVKGGAGNGHVIFFSLEDLMKGFAIPDDALNLGLHEMAHAIHVEYFDDKFEAKFPKWEKLAKEELKKLSSRSNSVLRNYAENNTHELFAVCVETFFEQPNQLKAQSHPLYEMMCELLNQRPI